MAAMSTNTAIPNSKRILITGLTDLERNESQKRGAAGLSSRCYDPNFLPGTIFIPNALPSPPVSKTVKYLY
jgi:hypothetical protein